jgi:hypothetical protein
MSKSTKKFMRFVGRGPAATTAEAKAREPEARGARAAGYDALTVKEVLANLQGLPPADLAKLGDHERSHQNRAAVLAGIDALLGHEPWPGYDDLDVTGVRTGLNGAGRERLATVLAYERANKNRAGVLLAAQQSPRSEPGAFAV